jgi:amino acid transporter
MDSTEPKVVGVAGVFTRASSGLVRQVSTRDTIYYGAMAITIAYMVFIVTAWPSYPGSSMELATLLVTIGGVLLGVVYALFASVYPRSGGEYVFLSRVVHPSVGFVISFIQAFWYAFYFGLNGAFFAIYGLAPLFVVLGLQWHSSALTSAGTWFSSHNGIFVMGSVMVLFIGFMVYRGLHGFFRLQRWAGLFALGSVLLTIVVLILGKSGVLHFATNFNAIAGSGAYAAVARAGSAPGFGAVATFNFMVWPAFSILFSVNMVSFSGEVKNVRRGPLIGIVGSMIVTGVLMIVLMYFGRGAFGSRFLQAAPTSAKVPVPPFLNVFASILANNPILTILISLWVVFVIPFALGSNVIYSSRAMLAWGLDGVAPRPFANVSERRHTPVFAILTLVVLAEVALAIFTYTTAVEILSGFLGFAIAFLVVCVAGIFFPFTHRDTLERSPANIKVAGIPLMTICGVLAAPFIAFIAYRTAVDPALGANAHISLIVNGILIAIGFAWFYGLRWYRKTRGEDVDRRFKEIPIE